MNGLGLLLADALLLFGVLCARPAASSVWRTRLLAQSGLVLACLAARAIGGGMDGVMMAGVLAMLAEIGVLLAFGRVWRGQEVPRRPIWPILVALLAAWLAIRLVPEPALPVGIGGFPGVSLGIVLAGLVGALAARNPSSRIAGLLLAGNGVLLGSCLLPGPGWGALAAIVLLQGWGLLTLLRPAGAAQ